MTRVRLAPARALAGRARLAPALAGAAVVAAMVLLPASAANAANPPSVTITGPSSGATFTTAPVTVTGNGTVTSTAVQTYTITNLSVTVSGPVAAAGSSCSNGACGATLGGGSTSFSFTPAGAYNGPYSVAVTMSAVCRLVLNLLSCSPPPDASASSSFALAVPPVAPRGVKATVNADNSVTVSWTANPEPDILGYQVQRVGPGSPNWTIVMPSTSSTTWTDKSTSAGGFYSYEVFAVRNGASGSSSDALSAGAAPANADVPVPPVSSTTVAGATTTVAPTSTTVPAPAPGVANISDFLNNAKAAGALPKAPTTVAPQVSAPQAVIPASPTTVGPPNTFDPALPYPVPLPTATTKAQGGQVALPSASKSSSGSHRPVLISVAGGLFLCLLGLGLRTANRRSRPAPLEPVADEPATGPVLSGGSGAAVVSPVGTGGEKPVGAGVSAGAGAVELVGAGVSAGAGAVLATTAVAAGVGTGAGAGSAMAGGRVLAREGGPSSGGHVQLVSASEPASESNRASVAAREPARRPQTEGTDGMPAAGAAADARVARNGRGQAGGAPAAAGGAPAAAGGGEAGGGAETSGRAGADAPARGSGDDDGMEATLPATAPGRPERLGSGAGRSLGAREERPGRSLGVAERAAAIGARRRSRLRSAGAGDDDAAAATFARPAPGQPMFPDLASSVSKLAQPEPPEDRRKKASAEGAVDYFRLIKHPDDAGDPEKVDSTN